MANDDLMVQCDLISNASRRTAWVPLQRGVKVGAVITLKDDDPQRPWVITRMSEPKPKSSLRTDWHNNI